MPRRTPSIQPKHSAWSTDSGQVMLGRPEPFLWKPTSTSASVSGCAPSQARKSSGVPKKMGSIAGKASPRDGARDAGPPGGLPGKRGHRERRGAGGEIGIGHQVAVTSPGDGRRPLEGVVGALVLEPGLAPVVAQAEEVHDAVGEAVGGVGALHDEQVATVDEQAVAAGERAVVLDRDLADPARGVAVLADLDAEELPGVRVDHDEPVGTPIALVAVTVAMVAALVVTTVVVDHDAVEVERG